MQSKYEFQAPVFIGFRAKDVTAPDGFAEPEVCSMSDCVSEMPSGWSDRWDWNRAWCYNSEAEASVLISGGTERAYSMFAYRMFPYEYDVDGTFPIDLPASLSDGQDIAPEPDLSNYRRIGYDVANGPTRNREQGSAITTAPQYSYNRGGFGCSPLSCNGCSKEFAVNRYYLLDDLSTAIAAAKAFGSEEPEPGPYYIYEVLRRQL